MTDPIMEELKNIRDEIMTLPSHPSRPSLLKLVDVVRALAVLQLIETR